MTRYVGTNDLDVTRAGEMTYLHVGHVAAELWPVDVEDLIDQLQSRLNQIEDEHPVKEA